MSAPDWSTLLPVNTVTGFLGSGKTTLLRRLLASPRLASTAVLVNEFGEVGLDHHLLEPVSESMVLLDNGCVCCAVRDDLRGALLDLHGRRERGEAPRYGRVVIESSGLADPAPILHTLTADPVLRHHYRPGAVVTVVDAVHGGAQLDRYPESVKQAALADRIVLTKTDIAEPAAVGRLRERLGAMNPAAPIRIAAPVSGAGGEGREESSDAVALLVEDVHRADSRRAEAERWLGLDRGGWGPAPRNRPRTGFRAGLHLDAGFAAAKAGAGANAGCGSGVGANGSEVFPDPGGGQPPTASPRDGRPAEVVPHAHTGGVTSFCIETDAPIDWTVFGIWLGMLLHRHGENVLRVKGIVEVPELDGPVLLNAVQHTVHPPTHLPAWPRTWERSHGRGPPRRGARIVFIVRGGLDRERIERSFAAFHDSLGAGREPSPPTPEPERRPHRLPPIDRARAPRQRPAVPILPPDG